MNVEQLESAKKDVGELLKKIDYLIGDNKNNRILKK